MESRKESESINVLGWQQGHLALLTAWDVEPSSLFRQSRGSFFHRLQLALPKISPKTGTIFLAVKEYTGTGWRENTSLHYNQEIYLALQCQFSYLSNTDVYRLKQFFLKHLWIYNHTNAKIKHQSCYHQKTHVPADAWYFSYHFKIT